VRASSFGGGYHLLPVGLRSLNKLTGIVDFFMENVECQKMEMPALTAEGLWRESG
jgi:prolyl-tRNA synthetase